MPIPALTSDGLLPPGVHECTAKEVEETFGRFQSTDARVRLTQRLFAYLEEARAAGLVRWIGIDGSYVTSKAAPSDIDMVLALRADHDFTAEVRPFQYNAVSKRRVKKSYGFDLLIAPEGTAALTAHLDFFQLTRDGKAKGLLKVAL